MFFEWIQAHQTLLWWLGGISLVTFLGTLIAIPLLIIRLPADYFKYRRPHPPPLFTRHPFLRLLFLILKNVMGFLFFLLGFVMLFIPGQGVLTMFIGIVLMNFPGKRNLERKIVRIPKILRTLNWIRLKANRSKLKL